MIRFLKGLIWFLFNIPTLGIPYLIWGRNKITDNSEEHYHVSFCIPVFSKPKEIKKILIELGVEDRWQRQVLGGKRTIVEQWFDENNARKLNKLIDLRVLGEHNDMVLDRRNDTWINRTSI